MNLCLLCDAQCPWDQGLCRDCHTDCPRPGIACRRCGHPLPRAGPCGACSVRPPPYTRLLAPFRYGYPIDALIRDCKYRDRLACVRLFGAALATEARRQGTPMPECLVPVPLHWRRCCARGFNQSLEIARVAGALLHIPIERHLVRRRRATPAQAGLRAEERRRNLRGAFVVTGEPCWKHAAIVDDVVTTGATAGEIGRVLLRAGVETVEVWAVARAG